MSRHRVQGRVVTIRREKNRTIIVGSPVAAGLMAELTPAQDLARSGDLGDDVAPLLAAADFFETLAMQAGLRGRLSRSSLCRVSGPMPNSQPARQALARLYEHLGSDAYSTLLEGCVWHRTVPPARQPLFRAALYAVAAWRRLLG